MNHLPLSDKISVATLSRIFDSTSASYKFLLFKSILDMVQTGNQRLSFKELALRSISQAWYAIHFYKISFGRSDRMTSWVAEIDKDMENKVLISQSSYSYIYEALNEMDKADNISSRSIDRFIKEFQALVPYRLISPWFSEQLRGQLDSKKNALILELSAMDSYQSLYSLSNSDELELIIKDEWRDYLIENYSVINGWWTFEYLKYLQKCNPTILSLATKLEPPIERNMSQVKALFKDYFKINKPKCIYTGQAILEDLSHDHFLPWSFLGDDPIYNFVPTTKSINSSKSNIIPSKKYLENASDFQYSFFNFLKLKNKKQVLESYQNNLKIELDAQVDEFQDRYTKFYIPLFLSAKNQGFETGWIYK